MGAGAGFTGAHCATRASSAVGVAARLSGCRSPISPDGGIRTSTLSRCAVSSGRTAWWAASRPPRSAPVSMATVRVEGCTRSRSSSARTRSASRCERVQRLHALRAQNRQRRRSDCRWLCRVVALSPVGARRVAQQLLPRKVARLRGWFARILQPRVDLEADLHLLPLGSARSGAHRGGRTGHAPARTPRLRRRRPTGRSGPADLPPTAPAPALQSFPGARRTGTGRWVGREATAGLSTARDACRGRECGRGPRRGSPHSSTPPTRRAPRLASARARQSCQAPPSSAPSQRTARPRPRPRFRPRTRGSCRRSGRHEGRTQTRRQARATRWRRSAWSSTRLECWMPPRRGF